MQFVMLQNGVDNCVVYRMQWSCRRLCKPRCRNCL